MNESLSNNRTFGVPKPLISDEFLIPMGIFIVVENCISFIILLRCNRLNSQIRFLNINLCLSDLSMGLLLSIPVKSVSIGGTCIISFVHTRDFTDNHDVQCGQGMCLVFWSQVLQIHQQKVSINVLYCGLDFGHCHYLLPFL